MTTETNPAYLQVSYHYAVQGSTNAASAGRAGAADGAGRLLDRILSNGTKTQYDYDTGGRLTHLKNTSAGGQIVNDTSYSRDRIGNILSQTEATGTGQAAGITTYTYDPAYRLTSADYPGTQNDEAFTYDKVGNRKTYTSGSLTANATTRYYQYNAGNRLLDQRTGSPTGSVFESYQYDANGSLAQIGGNRTLILTWDVNNRPSSIGGTSYQYDPAGYRIDKNGSQSRHYYLEGEHLETAYDGSGNLHAQYFRGSLIDEVVNGYQRDTNNKLVNYSYHHDALQSVLGQSGHEGSILATQSYGAFGNTQSQTGTSNNTLKYTGREEDSESGFYYYRDRHYDPSIGRFISEDPIGFWGGINQYTYCFNSPVNCNDPSGDFGLAGALIGAGVDVGIQLALNGGDFSDINYTSIGVSAALGAAGYVGGGNAAKSFLAGANIGRKEAIGEFGAAIKGLGQGRIPIAFQQKEERISKSYTRVDQIQKNVFTGKNTLVEAKYSTSGKPRLSPAQKLAVKELPPQGIDYRVVTTVPGEVMNASRIGSAALVGAVNSAMQSINALGAPQVPLGRLSVDLLGFGDTASGGYVLYPSKPNNNTTQAVYHK